MADVEARETKPFVTGSCLCGAVRYEVDSPAEQVDNCHCPMCRKQHGAAFATYAAYPKPDLRVVSGQNEVQAYQSGPETERHFCRICGSSLFWLETNGPRIWVAVGTQDGDPGRPMEGHIFVGSKAPWFTITDDLPQYERFCTTAEAG